MRIDPWLLRAAASAPERSALSDAGGELSYGELADLALAAATALRQDGVARGDAVAIALPPGRGFAVVLHACLLLGARALPLDPRLAAPEVEERAAGSRVVIREALRSSGGSTVAAEQSDAGEIATVMHTSGTTSVPRRIELTYGNWLHNALGSALALGLDPQERWLCALPLSHVGGLSILMRSTIYGTTVVLHERFDAGAVLRELSEQPITLVSLVPTMLARLLDAGLERVPGLRAILLGGAGATPALLDRAIAAGLPVRPTYGMTEACSQIATATAADPRGGALPLHGTEVAIAPDGEVLVKGPTIAPASIGPDGWLTTGDLGELDARGRLTIVGRKADTIVSGGENIAPAEVEAVLLEHPSIVDVAVHGESDPEWGEIVVASVVLAEGAEADAEALRAHCRGRLAAFKAPKQVRFLDALPRTATGKLLRREL